MAWIQYIITWIINPLFWVLALIFAVGVCIFILWLRKKRRLIFPVVEVVDLGRGKVGFNNLVGGYFGKHSKVRGLWWWGDLVFKTATGEEIRDLSTEDYQEINGKRGVVCYRHPSDQDILVPINKIDYENKELVMEIADASYRDVAAEIYQQSVEETTLWKEKVLQVVAYVTLFIIGMIIIIMVIQYAKVSQEKSAELLMQAGTKGAEMCKNIWSQAIKTATTVKGSAP